MLACLRSWIAGLDCLVSALLVTVTACDHHVRVAERDRLELTEVWTQQLPDSFDFAGATGPPEHLVIWSHSQPFLLERDYRGQLRELRLPVDRAPLGLNVVMGPDGRQVHLLDSTGAVLTHSRFPRDTVSIFKVQSAARIEEVDFLDGSWYVAALDSVGVLTIYQLKAAKLQRFFSFPMAHVGPASRLAHATLNGGDGRLIVSSRFSPFVTHVLNPNGAPILHWTSDLSGVALADSVRERLVSLSTLHLGDGYFQTLADPIGLLRVFVTYDEGGVTIHATAKAFPIGFIASYPATHVLLAFRRLGRQEIVAYRWRWVPALHQTARDEP